MKTINVGEVAVFDNVEPNKEQALKPLEEAAEVFGAWQEWNETKRAVDAVRVIEEIADTVQACVNLASAMGAESLIYAMRECKKRNIVRGRITDGLPEALDADGVPIEVGDKIYFVEGDDTPLKCMGFDIYGCVIFTDWKETGTIAYENPIAFTHKKPDSWEQLEEDIAAQNECIYFGMGKASTCNGCKAIYDSTLTCEEKKAKDIIRRAKALAGVKDE